jgi:hypothetical protein
MATALPLWDLLMGAFPVVLMLSEWDHEVKPGWRDAKLLRLMVIGQAVVITVLHMRLVTP